MAHVYSEGCVFNTLEDIRGKKITIMGLGLNGGGEACVKFFLKHDAFVTVTDKKTQEQLEPTILSIANDPTISQIQKSRLFYVLGTHRIEDFENADCVIKNPGVKIEGNEYLSHAKAIETDISIFLHFTKAPIIAVTGSKGKSSTVSAIDYGLRQAGFKSFLGGNITVSPLNFLEKTDGTTPVVLELSSWQLADLRGRKALKPKIAVLTKIVPDHQNWYGNMHDYIEDKKLIYADQTKDDFTLIDFDEDGYLKECENPKPGCKCWGDEFASETKGRLLRYSREELPADVMGVFQKSIGADKIAGFVHVPFELRDRKSQIHETEIEKIMGDLKVPGDHNRANVLNACMCLYLMGVNPELIQNILGEWKGIPHRLEHFLDWESPDGKTLQFYNDSAATVPEAAAAASQSFGKKIILICGGTDKQLDFIPLAKTLAKENGTKYEPLQIYLLAGTGTDKLFPMLDFRGVEYNGPFDSLEVLLGVLKNTMLSKNNLPSEIPVVFSPGATSFGMFLNEFDRGNKFKATVKELFGASIM